MHTDAMNTARENLSRAQRVRSIEEFVNNPDMEQLFVHYPNGLTVTLTRESMLDKLAVYDPSGEFEPSATEEKLAGFVEVQLAAMKKQEHVSREHTLTSAERANMRRYARGLVREQGRRRQDPKGLCPRGVCHKVGA